LRQIVLVDEVDAAEVEAVYQKQRVVLEGAQSMKSRFSSALKLFPTGRLASKQVDDERLRLKEDESVIVDATALRGSMTCQVSL
jgi:hypothetical protein